MSDPLTDKSQAGKGSTVSESPLAGRWEQLGSRVAERADVTLDEVRDVFATYGVPLVLTPARPRALRLVRLRMSGVRAGNVAAGAFDTTIPFGSGLTALVASNFRGKTSVLELITWCLRGSPRELQSGVKGWLHQLDLDITVGEQHLGFRLDLEEGSITNAVVLAAASSTALADRRAPSAAQHVHAVLHATGDQSYADQVENLMLDRLDLVPVVNAFKETGTQTHGWPTYFAALYLGSASTKILLGDQKIGGLAGRLLQVFLDLPAAAALTRVRTAHDVRANQIRDRQAEERRAAEASAHEREQLQSALTAERSRLAELTSQTEGGESLSELARRAARLALEVADARTTDDDARLAAHHTLAERRRAAKRLTDVRESGVARALFQGLDPDACPRCDQAITTERTRLEQESHACAVCSREVEIDGVDDAEVVAEAEARLAAAEQTDNEAQAEAARTRDELARLTGELSVVDGGLRRAQSVASLPDVVESQRRIWQLEGGLAVLPEVVLDDGEESSEARTLRVLASAAKVLDDANKNAAEELFADLNDEIAELSRRFGMNSLEEVKIDRSARLRVTQDGGGKDWFSDCNPGARLRLRIALVIALLRVGAAHGVATHPGLIMIDSPKAEEVQDLDATTLFRELAKVAEEQALQVVITTRDYDLVHAVLDEAHSIEAVEGEPLW
ncbi:ATP-binding protein [Pseudonocardia oroxyli]|uniref:AAA domain-containing protein n=1 Tax=Pseudonocardia oroxyli TaxID=366584 RepID=A0A1G8ENR1_PSEOR|nr:ATP-binding protein [Pseudonocardia oroxyli]SDH71505.1 hypothetical protein SAMN05216377_1406 [Pseudonocardia oroxyli]